MTKQPFAPGNRARVDFIKTELHLAQTYCALAQRRDGNRQRMYLKNARMAHANVVRFMLRATLTDDDFAYITANVERLKFTLDELERQASKDNPAPRD